MSGVHGWFKPQNKNKNKSPAHSQTPKQELHSTNTLKEVVARNSLKETTQLTSCVFLCQQQLEQQQLEQLEQQQLEQQQLEQLQDDCQQLNNLSEQNVNKRWQLARLLQDSQTNNLLSTTGRTPRLLRTYSTYLPLHTRIGLEETFFF